MKRSCRYGELVRRLPGISTTVLADGSGSWKQPGSWNAGRCHGSGVTYAVTERGLGLTEALAALRRWGVEFLTDPVADGAKHREYDVHYVEGIDALGDGEFGLVVDGRSSSLRFSGGRLDQMLGEPENPRLIVHTTGDFMERWATGTASWDDGLKSGDVTLEGPAEEWEHWLAATGYLHSYEPAAASA